MEENVKIYKKESGTQVMTEPANNSKWNSGLAVVQSILKQQAEEERRLNQKYPWYGILMNWLVVLVVTVGLIVYGVQVINARTEARAASLAATAFAEYQAEQDALEQERLQALAAEQNGREAIRKAQLFYGIRNFEKKYGYDRDDLYTLARCVFNRVENPNYPNTVKGVIEQESQWIGYSDDNPMLGNYYQIAYKALEEWEYEETKPVGTDFVWAEFDENGIWLKNEFDTSGMTPAQLKNTYWSYGS